MMEMEKIAGGILFFEKNPFVENGWELATPNYSAMVIEWIGSDSL